MLIVMNSFAPEVLHTAHFLCHHQFLLCIYKRRFLVWGHYDHSTAFERKQQVLLCDQVRPLITDRKNEKVVLAL